MFAYWNSFWIYIFEISNLWQNERPRKPFQGFVKGKYELRVIVQQVEGLRGFHERVDDAMLKL